MGWTAVKGELLHHIHFLYTPSDAPISRTGLGRAGRKAREDYPDGGDKNMLYWVILQKQGDEMPVSYEYRSRRCSRIEATGK